MVGAYVWILGGLTWAQQSNFGTFGYDMGIYDQGIWLLSRFQEPFVTIRGLNFFGHHVNLVVFFLVPFYWLGAGPHFLYLFETVFMAAGAVPLWLLARDRLATPWGALVPAGSYLLYPSLEWINWWHFHPDALIITPLLFAWWFYRSNSWTGYFVAIGVAMSCKEDAALAVFMVGLIVTAESLWRGRGRLGSVALRLQAWVGAATIAAAICWWFVCTSVIIPWANNGIGPFYAHLFPGLGDSLLSVARNIIVEPSLLWDLASEESRLTYYSRLLVPVAFLPLASPAVLIAAPQLLINLISAHGYTHDFKYHYTSILIAAIFLGTVEAVASLGRKRSAIRWLLLIALAGSSIYSHVRWSPSPLGESYRSGIWAQPHDRHKAARAAIELIPSDAAVTATYYLAPHLTHRRLIYEFPNPWRVANWGVKGENPGRPADVEYLVIDTRLTGNDSQLYSDLIATEGPFEVIFSVSDIEVARRGSAGAP
jgi:uncharacterized membrane protein